MSEKTLSLTDYKCRVIVHMAAGVPVVFLHGYSYTSSIWQRLSITELLVDKHVPFLALDMPYGVKSECQPKTRSEETNIALVREAAQSVFGATSPVLVGASLGGHIAVVYDSRYPVKGLFLSSPTRTLEEALVKAYANFTFPVRVTWGSEDSIVSGEELRTFVDKLPCGKLSVYEGAGHSAYTQQPERFKRELLELYAAAEQA
ncbi:MAG: alpha/beta fold hydrolase [Candidatus Bathyarchaeia archaeon]